MNGVGDGKFDPDGKLTRAMLVTILYRHEEEPDIADATNPFTDVPADKWYTNAVIWAASEGIVNGVTETTFSPDATITREQIATILYRYAGKPDATGDLSTYPDEVAVSTYAVDAMRWAVGMGIINGMDGKLAPQSSATRAQIATIFYRYLNQAD